MAKKSFIITMEHHRTITVPFLFIAGFLGVLAIAGFNDVQQALTYTELAIFVDRFFSEAYVMLGFLAIFLYEFIPTAFRLLSTTGFFIGLLEQGFNPFLLILISTIGRLGGFYLLYLLGRFIFRIFKKKDRTLADAEHFLHKYKIIVFFSVPFLGVLGDLVMVIAGHQRLGFVKIAPFLFLSNLLRYEIWLYVTIGQINLVNT